MLGCGWAIDGPDGGCIDVGFFECAGPPIETISGTCGASAVHEELHWVLCATRLCGAA